VNILILTGRFGMGHASAAGALAAELTRSVPAADVVVEDFPAYAMPSLSPYMYRGFHLLVTHASDLFNMYYKLIRYSQSDSSNPLDVLFLDKLLELVEKRRPDLIISTHPFCAHLCGQLRQKTGLDIPLVTCVTDISDHPEWICAETDCYLLPSWEVRRRFQAKGVPGEKLFVTGIPVGQQFRALSYSRGREQRQLLIMGGGFGMLPMESSFYQKLNALRGVHTTVITGKNQKLFQRLHGAYENIEAVGYTHWVARYMARADLLVTKPGGITLFESMFAELPLLAWQPKLHQEKENARWLQAAGVGWVTQGMCSVEDISQLLFHDTALAGARQAIREWREKLEEESIHCLISAIEQSMEVNAECR